MFRMFRINKRRFSSNTFQKYEELNKTTKSFIRYGIGSNIPREMIEEIGIKRTMCLLQNKLLENVKGTLNKINSKNNENFIYNSLEDYILNRYTFNNNPVFFENNNPHFKLTDSNNNTILTYYINNDQITIKKASDNELFSILRNLLNN